MLQELMMRHPEDKIGTSIEEEITLFPYGYPDEMDFIDNFSGTSVEERTITKEKLYMRFNNIRRKNPPMLPISDNSLRTKTISDVLINGNKIKLLEPIQLNVEFVNQRYILYNEDLKLSAISNYLEMAVSEIKEEFSFLWDNYVKCPEEELTEGGKRLRNKLMRIANEL